MRPLAFILGIGGALLAYATRAWWSRGKTDQPDEPEDIRSRGPVVNYVPGEICVVVSADQIADPRRFYTAVAESLNRSLADLLGAAPPPDGGRLAPRSSFEQDLEPVTLRRYASGGAAPRPLLQELSRRGEVDVPLVLLPPAREGRTNGLHFYRLALDNAPADVATRLACGRELVNVVNGGLDKLNRDLLRYLAQLPGGGSLAQNPRVDAATPNWLAAGAQDEDHTEAGPGAGPKPVEPSRLPGRGRFTFRFDPTPEYKGELPPVRELVEEQRKLAQDGQSSDVLVAILDTCPPKDSVTQAANAHPDNTLLQEVAAHVSIGESPSLDAGSGYFTHLVGSSGLPLLLNWQDKLPNASLGAGRFLMPDHGLFAAGIIRDIAPGAEVHLIRVLNDYGAGDLLALCSVLRQLPDLVKQRGKKHLVVNLSLVVDLPPDEQLLRLWFPKTSGDLPTLRQRMSDVDRTLQTIRRSLDVVLSWIVNQEQQVLVVAAAGNDNGARAWSERPAPRWPARFDHVLGVAAVDLRRLPAEFSNRGDFVVLGNGVATFGGNARRSAIGTLPEITTSGLPNEDVDAIAGVFSAESLPLAAGPNDTGWVYWAGTSFASPVVTGIAADVWASAAGATYTPQQVIEAVRDYATVAEADLACPSIPAHQEFVNW